MDKTILISMPVEDLQLLIIDCVNSCLKHNTPPPRATNLQNNALLNVEEAAAFLRLTKPTIYSKVNRREIPVMKKGNRLYFSKQELTEYLQSGRKSTIEEIDARAEQYLHQSRKR